MRLSPQQIHYYKIITDFREKYVKSYERNNQKLKKENKKEKENEGEEKKENENEGEETDI